MRDRRYRWHFIHSNTTWQYTTSHEGYPSGAKTFVWLKEFDVKIYFRATWSGFFFGFSLKNLLSRIMQFMIYIFYVTIFTFCFIFVQITNWLQCLFIFALVWSIGGTINGDSRKKFDAFFRLLISGTDKDHPKPNNIKMTKVTGRFYSRVLYKTRPVKL